MKRTANRTKLFAATDCVIFGFDGESLKILLIQRLFEPEKGKWSLMGGFINKEEDCETAASRVLKHLTGLTNIYMEQLHTFSKIDRDPRERIISTAYFALIDIHKYHKQISKDYNAEWFPVNKMPKLAFDHTEIAETAKKRLRYKAAVHPILFELLPEKFTIPQLQLLYESVYDTAFDKRNFSRKLLSTQLLIKQNDKNKTTSKKGAYYYKLDKKKYLSNFQTFLNIVPNPHNFI